MLGTKNVKSQADMK